MRHWLMKSEPDTFSIRDLERVKVEPWSGVRSFFARAHMRAMTVGDAVLFHHSSVQPPGVAGLAKVVRTSVVDETQFDPKSPYFDEKATREKPIWDCVDVEFVEVFPHFVTMDRLRAEPALADMMVLKVGRLSVQPVTEEEYARVVEMGHTEPPAVVAVAKSRSRSRSKSKTKSKSKSRSKSKSKSKSRSKPRQRS